MRRFYFDPKSRSGDAVFLSEEESHHIAKVLRLPVGSEVELLDGLGTVYRAVIGETGRRVVLRIEGVAATAAEPGKTVWVGQGILKGEKMDTVVQKCTELGVTRFTPFHSSRCQGRFNPSQTLKKHERWQRVGLAACKQCLRLQTMQQDVPIGYNELLQDGDARRDDLLRLLFWEEEKDRHLYDIPAIGQAKSIALMLGPEGGFSRQEVELARESGWRTVSLGERILRAETATLTAVSIVQYLIGNL